MTRPNPPRSLLARLPVAVVCVYGPFVAAPFVSGLADDPEARAGWFWALPVLPGLLAGRFAGSDAAVWLAAGGATALWVLVTVWVTRRTWTPAVLSLLFAAGLAALTVGAFAA